MTSTPAASAVKRVPVEIWRRVFELYLGPSLLEPEEQTLRGYQSFLSNEQTLLQKYVSIERERGALRLVCNSWRDLADTLGDRIMISHLDEYDWPPHRRRQDANYICYRHSTQYSDENPISVYRRRIRQENVRPVPLPIKLDSRQLPLAPFTLLVTSKLDFSSIGFEVDPADVHYLKIGPCASLHDITHPVFHNVRILDLSGVYPFENVDGIERERTLPHLLCLIILVGDESQPNSRTPTNSLSTWHFPKLVMFSFSVCDSSQGLSEDLLDFIHHHAATLEELDLPRDMTRDYANQIDWSRFVCLNSVKLLDLSGFANTIPTLARRWETTWKPGVDVAPPSVLHLHISACRWLLSPDPLPEAGTLTRLRLYQPVFHHLMLHLNTTWARVSRNIEIAYYNAGDEAGTSSELGNRLRHYLQTLIEFIALIDGLKLSIVDSSGVCADSDEANALRSQLSDSSY